jgi:hypothetical protein
MSICDVCLLKENAKSTCVLSKKKKRTCYFKNEENAKRIKIGASGLRVVLYVQPCEMEVVLSRWMCSCNFIYEASVSSCFLVICFTPWRRGWILDSIWKSIW